MLGDKVKFNRFEGRIFVDFQMYLHYASISSNLTLLCHCTYNIHTKLPQKLL